MGMAAGAIGGLASAGSSIMGGMMGAQGAKQEGQAAKDNAIFQAWMANINSEIEDRNAQMEMQNAETNSYNAGLEGRTALGKLGATQAASGVDINSGSFVNTRQSVENASLQNESNIRFEGANKYYGFKMQAWQDRAQAMMDLLEGKNAEKAAGIKARASMISGIGGAVSGLAGMFNG